MTQIVQKENPVLRKKALEVPPEEIASAKIKKVITRMKEALVKETDGVALAAPQIGESWRIFVVSRNFPRFLEKEKREGPMEQKSEIKPWPDDLVFINPEIIKLSKEKKYLPEGCLSVRWLYGEIKRASRCRIRAYNEKGERKEFGASGLLAQAFQHEIDHLNGILFIDKARNIKEVKPEDLKKNEKN